MSTIDSQFAEGLAEHNGLSIAKLGLRFDRVVVEIQSDLRDFAEKVVPNGSTVFVTITAPIRLPTKTPEVIKDSILKLAATKSPRRELSATVHQNKVRIRLVEHSLKRVPKSITLVHNPNKNSRMLLDMCSDWMHKASQLSD